jgi:hypothetical protein
MSAREHDIDRVASAMTTGTPGADFTARVMAPICGRPQPGFTWRVMARVDTAATRARSPLGARALRPALALGAAVAILAARWGTGDAPLPPTPAPVLVDARIGEAAFAVPAPFLQPFVSARVAPQPATAERQTPGAPEPFVTDAVSALNAPAPIVMRSIEPLSAAVPSLSGPAALAIPPLRVEKERR